MLIEVWACAHAAAGASAGRRVVVLEQGVTVGAATAVIVAQVATGAVVLVTRLGRVVKRGGVGFPMCGSAVLRSDKNRLGHLTQKEERESQKNNMVSVPLFVTRGDGEMDGVCCDAHFKEFLSLHLVGVEIH